MDISCENRDDVIVLNLAGKIDIDSSPELKAKVLDLIEEGYMSVFIDFSKITFMNSSGLGSLISTIKEARLKDAGLIIINPTTFIKSLFKLTQLDKILTIYDSLEEALKNE